ncbi:MAG: glycerate kinase [Bacteroidetes bacterium]|nr:MAG: glycerate kinase [Bacteroidota bacterium]
MSPSKRILLVPNAMKGALTAPQIAAVMRRSLLRARAGHEVVSLPAADGGNGTLDCLMSALGGTVTVMDTAGPVAGERVTARYGVTPDGTGIIESALAAGLQHINPAPETVAHSTTRGVGELMRAASERGARRLWVGLGGTATNDAGAGMARALGANVTDENGDEVPDGAIALLRTARVSAPVLPLSAIPVTALADARNPLLGGEGATYTYARQKGASDEQLPYLESAVRTFADAAEAAAGRPHRDLPGAGAAGGLGFGLSLFCGAEIVSGIDHILDAVRFDEMATACDAIVTAEGMLDGQTLFGKGIAGICRRAQRFGVPVHAFVGRVRGDAEELRIALGLASLTAISPDDLPPLQAMRDASWLLADAIYHHRF